MPDIVDLLEAWRKDFVASKVTWSLYPAADDGMIACKLTWMRGGGEQATIIRIHPIAMTAASAAIVAFGREHGMPNILTAYKG